MLPFIQGELIESRLLRTVHGVNGRNARDLAKMMYTAILALEILRWENPAEAQRYARDSIMFGDYDTLKPAASDLYNLMVILSNQDQYKEIIVPDYDVSPALLETKNYLRRIYNGMPSQMSDRFILLNMQQLLNIQQVDIIGARRTVAFWDDHSRAAQKMTDFPDIMYNYTNNRVEDLSKLNASDFVSFVESNPKISGVKKQKIAEYVNKNKKDFDNAFNAVKAIAELKNSIISQLDSKGGEVKASIGNQPGGEGYVINAGGNKIKLVNRGGFTAANRSVQR
jgi:hypothetical protein